MSKKQPHGNSLDSKREQYLYALYDHEERTIHKFGISDRPIKADGQCSRMRRFLRLLNQGSGFLRYTGRVVFRGIKDRLAARREEDAYVDRYVNKHGKEPRGNKNHIRVAGKK